MDMDFIYSLLLDSIVCDEVNSYVIILCIMVGWDEENACTEYNCAMFSLWLLTFDVSNFSIIWFIPPLISIRRKSTYISFRSLTILYFQPIALTLIAITKQMILNIHCLNCKAHFKLQQHSQVVLLPNQH